MASSNVPGGSAVAMVENIAEGHLLVTERAFGDLSATELDQLTFALEGRLRDLRAERPAADQAAALAERNRRIQRLGAARAMLAAYRRQRHR